MFSIFKKSNVVSDIEWLGVDIHSHILPGLDDGAQNLAESLHFINSMQELGFNKLICTPHIYKELYPNTPETIQSALDEIKGSLSPSSTLIVEAAAEHMVDYSFVAVDGLNCLPNKYILIEMSYLSETPNIESFIFNLQVKGYKIVLAHPERYNFYHKTLDRYNRLKDIGCLFQLNLLSVLGYYGKNVKNVADYLLKSNLYDVAGSDLHHNKHLSLLSKSIREGQLYELIGKYPFKNQELFL
jgi:protein-tyrosine phosphatase